VKNSSPVCAIHLKDEKWKEWKWRRKSFRGGREFAVVVGAANVVKVEIWKRRK
jgi:hypothetical protein